ncbi:MAG: transporter substrate-binding domain-containing protein [Candidatus Latescibacterota bacterium]|nr:MAG: transporter substrate-binding domain-containing protein [Candidatus Latescibacterota bacterium]
MKPIVLAVLIAMMCGTHVASQVDTLEDILDRPVRIFTGDLDEIRERRMIRVLTTYNQTNFFLVGGKIHGFEYELLAKYEKHLNKNVSRRQIRTDMVFIPVQKDQLLPLLEAGKGDIVAAGLTLTPERLQKAAFTTPYLTDVEEIVVTSKDVDDVHGLRDLAGREVYAVKGSSYVEHLRTLNKWAEHFNRPPIAIMEIGNFMETEDLLEMTNAGIIDIMVADRHLAELWSRVFEDIVLREDLVINSGGELAWAVRKDNPELLADLNEFIKQNKKGTLLGNILFERYYEGTKWVTNPLSPRMKKHSEMLISIFKEYGEKYNIDWLSLAALAYQESGFNQNLKSHRGAVGIMQITPSTAKQVGFSDVSNVRDNIHAGTKYLDWIRTTYFQDPEISTEDKVNFTLAAYNAGPRRVAKMRNRTKEMGLDSNKWFYNVERAALREVGQETVRYVANINKYYIIFKMSVRMLEKEKG